MGNLIKSYIDSSKTNIFIIGKNQQLSLTSRTSVKGWTWLKAKIFGRGPASFKAVCELLLKNPDLLKGTENDSNVALEAFKKKIQIYNSHHSCWKRVNPKIITQIDKILNTAKTTPKEESKGIKLYTAEKYKEAIIELEQELKLDPNNSILQSNLGYSYYYEARYQEALEHLKMVKPDKYQQRFLGVCYFNLGEYQEAIKVFQELVKIDNDCFNRFYLGVSYLYTGDKDQARNHLEIAVSLDPNDTDARYYLSWTDVKSKEVEENSL